MLTKKEPDIHILTAVNFGDRPSGTIATLALRMTAEMSKAEHPRACEAVMNSTYVDDIADSVKNQKAATEVTEDISSILQRGNFHIKKWHISGRNDDCVDLCSNSTEKVFGVSWLPKSDDILFNV